MTENPEVPESALDMTPAEYRAAREAIRRGHTQYLQQQETARVLERLARKWSKTND